MRHYLGVPPGVTSAPRDDAVWVTAGQMAVVTWGSSGCPGLPSRLNVSGSNALTVMVTSYSRPARSPATSFRDDLRARSRASNNHLTMARIEITRRPWSSTSRELTAS
jgi:hypothetical protein